MRDETQKNATAIQKASEKKAGPDVACKLFKTFLASEQKMIEAIETNAELCGVPPDRLGAGAGLVISAPERVGMILRNSACKRDWFLALMDERLASGGYQSSEFTRRESSEFCISISRPEG